MFKVSSLAAIVLGVSSILAPLSVIADYTQPGFIVGGPTQHIVVTVSENPLRDPDSSCLAITLAGKLAEGGFNVTFFPTRDAVVLGDAKMLVRPRLRCTDPADPESTVRLKQLLEEFIGANQNNMVTCTLCWVERYGSKLPDYGFIDYTGEAVGQMFWNADKIVDF